MPISLSDTHANLPRLQASASLGRSCAGLSPGDGPANAVVTAANTSMGSQCAFGFYSLQVRCPRSVTAAPTSLHNHFLLWLWSKPQPRSHGSQSARLHCEALGCGACGGVQRIMLAGRSTYYPALSPRHALTIAVENKKYGAVCPTRTTTTITLSWRRQQPDPVRATHKCARSRWLQRDCGREPGACR